jgi:hypothetical protein
LGFNAARAEQRSPDIWAEKQPKYLIVLLDTQVINSQELVQISFLLSREKSSQNQEKVGYEIACLLLVWFQTPQYVILPNRVLYQTRFFKNVRIRIFEYCRYFLRRQVIGLIYGNGKQVFYQTV